MKNFTLISSDWPGQAISKCVYSGCNPAGGNMSPAVEWIDAPEDVKSFAVTLYDPDAPSGSGWWHWIVFNIPPSTASLPGNAGKSDCGLMPKGALQGRNDFGENGYDGPCPPKGDKAHRYILTVYALNVSTLEGLNENSSAARIGFAINAAAIQKASLISYYAVL